MVQDTQFNIVLLSKRVNDAYKTGSLWVGRSKSLVYTEHTDLANTQMCITQCREQSILNINAGYEVHVCVPVRRVF